MVHNRLVRFGFLALGSQFCQSEYLEDDVTLLQVKASVKASVTPHEVAEDELSFDRVQAVLEDDMLETVQNQNVSDQDKVHAVLEIESLLRKFHETFHVGDEEMQSEDEFEDEVPLGDEETVQSEDEVALVQDPTESGQRELEFRRTGCRTLWYYREIQQLSWYPPGAPIPTRFRCIARWRLNNPLVWTSIWDPYKPFTYSDGGDHLSLERKRLEWLDRFKSGASNRHTLDDWIFKAARLGSHTFNLYAHGGSFSSCCSSPIGGGYGGMYGE